MGLLGTRIPWKSPPLPFFLALGITQGRKLKLIRSQPRQKKHLGAIGPLALASEHANQPLSSHPLTQAISPAPPPPTPTVLSAASLPHLHSSLDIFFFLIFLNCAFHKTFRKKSQEMRFRGRRWRTVGGGGRGGGKQALGEQVFHYHDLLGTRLLPCPAPPSRWMRAILRANEQSAGDN